MQVWLDRSLTLLACAVGVVFLILAIRNASENKYEWAAFNALCALPGYLAAHWAARHEH